MLKRVMDKVFKDSKTEFRQWNEKLTNFVGLIYEKGREFCESNGISYPSHTEIKDSCLNEVIPTESRRATSADGDQALSRSNKDTHPMRGTPYQNFASRALNIKWQGSEDDDAVLNDYLAR